MNLLRSIKSILFQEGVSSFIKRKRNKTFLDNRTLFTMNYEGRKVKIFLNKKFGYVDQYIFDQGIYEKDIIRKIREHLSPEKTMLDIGGNIGQHSLLLAPYCKKIYAFEPIPAIYSEFKQSISANRYENIELHNTAISDENSEKTIYFSSKNAGSSSFLSILAENRTPIKVHTSKIADIISNDVKVDVVKIDVEGFEAKVILGNRDFFVKNRPIIFLEFCPSNIDTEGTFKAKDLVSFFIENQYEIESQRLDKILSFKRPEEIYETDNWICIPK
ncbi:FkbM family methyltransferase [Chryseobacterium koreense]|uniref:Methyltransferase FkbM domain-containing protein n=1 Tax=Chryseobacterium koreense CCUG 49689 TaxID=1304281 RepID=A0A0J7J247_9FLAO|nr:FkbM family methyltransferase [Chryseobacterium koreense]KMQ72131.1 hypothetical protein ACM44_03725 [Chryseobacterium koreense CCUG 49689]MBB5331981.1 FkbM family methyltransferase [Chryseobacterium koreense]